MVRLCALIACVVACRDVERAVRRVPSSLEVAITRDLTARFGAGTSVRCVELGGVPIGCRATLRDQRELAIRVAGAGSAWQWRVDGLVVDPGAVQAYVDGVLGDLGVAQTAQCPEPPHARGGERITCRLSGGGAAFVDLRADGQLAIELAIDPAAATARTTAVPDRDLARMSHALERLGDEAEK